MVLVETQDSVIVVIRVFVQKKEPLELWLSVVLIWVFNCDRTFVSWKWYLRKRFLRRENADNILCLLELICFLFWRSNCTWMIKILLRILWYVFTVFRLIFASECYIHIHTVEKVVSFFKSKTFFLTRIAK